MMNNLILSFLLLCSVSSINAQQQTSPILFIYDASGSMWGQLAGKTKKEIASNVLASTVGNLPENQKVGLIVYGHRQKDDCDDIEYKVDLTNSSKSNLTDAVRSLTPTGRTPLARSAAMAIKSLRENNTKATIILITDGIESCDGNICELVTSAKASGIDFKLHVVGLGLKEGETQQLECAASAGGGHYYDVADAEALGDALMEVTTQTVDKPDVNFSVYAVKNGKPVDAWVKPTDAVTKKVHLGVRTYRDTAWMYLPPGKYNVDIKPLEGSDIPATTVSIEMKEGTAKHQDISFDGGTLEVTTTNNGEPWDAVVKMYDKNTGKVVANTRTYGVAKQMEVPAGSYKVTYQALALEGIDINAEIDNVQVSAGKVNSISHDFKSGIAMIGVKTTSGELIDATVNFHEKTTGKNVAGSRTYTSEKNNPRKFVLNPGTYDVKVVTLGAHKGKNETFTIVVKEGEIVEKILSY
ncbi:MAG: VWA domain-containing protein [Cyclobacteriaceae bacterium]